MSVLECHSLSHQCDSTKCLAWISGPCPLIIHCGSSILLTTIFNSIRGSLRRLRIPRDFQTVLHLFYYALSLSCPFELDSPGTQLDSHFIWVFCCCCFILPSLPFLFQSELCCFLIPHPPRLTHLSFKTPTETGNYNIDPYRSIRLHFA